MQAHPLTANCISCWGGYHISKQFSCFSWAQDRLRLSTSPGSHFPVNKRRSSDMRRFDFLLCCLVALIKRSVHHSQPAHLCQRLSWTLSTCPEKTTMVTGQGLSEHYWMFICGLCSDKPCQRGKPSLGDYWRSLAAAKYNDWLFFVFFFFQACACMCIWILLLLV